LDFRNQRFELPYARSTGASATHNGVFWLDQEEQMKHNVQLAMGGLSRLGELKQLFNAIDPSPFRDKDLDPKAEEFIVGWAKELPRDATLALVVDLDREAGLPDRWLPFPYTSERVSS